MPKRIQPVLDEQPAAYAAEHSRAFSDTSWVRFLSILSQAEIAARRASYGENRLPAEKSASPLAVLLAQVNSPLAYIILVMALVSLIPPECGVFAFFMAVAVIDVILGFLQEYQAQEPYAALKGLLKPTTAVVRDGERREVEVW